MHKSNQAILNELRNYIDGLMLSDGCIQYDRGNKTGWYQQNCKYKEWLEVISENFCKYIVECNLDDGRLITGGYSPKGGSITYFLRTRHYVEFKEMKDRWYKKWYDIDNYPERVWHLDTDSGEYYIFKKIVPKDILLTSSCVANWYLGDGNRSISYSNNQITIATNGFLNNDTTFLSELLSNTLNIKCSIDKHNRIGIYNKSNIKAFLNYINEYKIDCFDYKFLEART